MTKKTGVHHVNSHHALLTDVWTKDVHELERGIEDFAVPPAYQYHVSLFEMAGDADLHVNVTHREQTKHVKGWSGPGVSANGHVHNRRFHTTSSAEILRCIHQMVFAERA
jgi:hypothetical protein